MSCEDQIYSNDYYDLIIDRESSGRPDISGFCIQPIDTRFYALYIPREGLPELNISNYTFSAIPKCYTLSDQSALEASGILKVQNQPTLALKGNGVLLGFLDTGIAYTNPVFRNSDGSSRIAGIWDQTIRGNPPEGFLYGSEYLQEVINEALLAEDPYTIVPSQDENGHGTYVAGVAAGGRDAANEFSGAAPEADIAVVKLKQAKQYLRDFYFIPDQAVAFEETDIMAAVYYLWRLASKRNQPLVICLALGSNMGSHDGTNPLAYYLGDVAIRQMCAVITTAGNEANARHHYLGSLSEEVEYDQIEISVGAGVTGFTAQLWAGAPELYSVTVMSPTGEIVPMVYPRTGERKVYQFIFEETVVSIDYRVVGISSGDQLIYIRFEKPTRGIWSIQVYGSNYLTDSYHVWLPNSSFLSGEVVFLRSNPYYTVNVPGDARAVITVGGYNTRDNSLYIDSGRGYTVNQYIKPDFVAPAVEVYGPSARAGIYENRTGTSAAAAVTAGAGALFMEWVVLRRGATNINTVQIKNFFIRGAAREDGRTYPNREWGYGRLNLYDTFDALREYNR